MFLPVDLDKCIRQHFSLNSMIKYMKGSNKIA